MIPSSAGEGHTKYPLATAGRVSGLDLFGGAWRRMPSGSLLIGRFHFIYELMESDALKRSITFRTCDLWSILYVQRAVGQSKSSQIYLSSMLISSMLIKHVQASQSARNPGRATDDE